MRFLSLLHIAAAILTIGPLTAAALSAPAAIRSGKESLPLLRWLNRATRFYALGSVAVFVLGLALVRPDYSFNEFWISASMTLFIVALALVLIIVERDQRNAISRLEGGHGASVQAGRILATSIAVTVMWVVILALMTYKPGSPDNAAAGGSSTQRPGQVSEQIVG